MGFRPQIGCPPRCNHRASGLRKTQKHSHPAYPMLQREKEHPMVVHIASVAYQGIQTVPADVKAHISGEMRAFTIVGPPKKPAAESKDRVRPAIQSLGVALPAKRILLNLAPADVFKEGSHF